MSPKKSEEKQPAKLEARCVLQGNRLQEYRILKAELGIESDSEMIRWLIHQSFCQKHPDHILSAIPVEEIDGKFFVKARDLPPKS